MAVTDRCRAGRLVSPPELGHRDGVSFRRSVVYVAESWLEPLPQWRLGLAVNPHRAGNGSVLTI
jgi:hypothetical protein